MPLFILVCPTCGTISQRLLANAEVANAGLPCPAKGCGGVMKRSTSAPSLHNKEVLRMGHQIKDVEKFTDSTQLYEERSHADYRKA